MRNVNILGRTLVAIIVISAMVAPAASAQGKLTTISPVTLTGMETGPAGSTALTAFGLRLECVGSTYTGHAYNVTPHGLISNPATTFTLTPHYNQPFCRANPGNFPATITMNGCDQVVHIGATTGGVAGTFAVTVDLVCPAGKEITITMFTSSTKHLEGKPFCTLHIPSQAGLVGAHATSTVGGDFDLAGTIVNAKVAKTNAGEDALLCPSQETSAASIDIDVTFKGINSLGEPTNIALSD